MSVSGPKGERRRPVLNGYFSRFLRLQLVLWLFVKVCQFGGFGLVGGLWYKRGYPWSNLMMVLKCDAQSSNLPERKSLCTLGWSMSRESGLKLKDLTCSTSRDISSFLERQISIKNLRWLRLGLELVICILGMRVFKSAVGFPFF